MFVFGQVVKANVLLYHIQEHADTVNKLQDELDSLQAQCESGIDVKEKIAELRSAIEINDAEINNGLEVWVKRYEYLIRSSDLLQESGKMSNKNGLNQLIITTDNAEMEVTATVASRFDLLEFVNQACELVPSVDVASARFRKARLLDLLLDREGRSPLFFKLSEDDALKAGNALTRFMADVVGHQGVTALLSGEVSLEQAKVHGFDELLSRSLEATGPDGTRHSCLPSASDAVNNGWVLDKAWGGQ